MAEPARVFNFTTPPAFTKAHRAVLDAMGFLSAERVHHANRALVIDTLDRALDQADATGWPPLDRVLDAARFRLQAERALKRGEPKSSLGLMAAALTADHAMTEFYWARLALTAEAQPAKAGAPFSP